MLIARNFSTRKKTEYPSLRKQYRGCHLWARGYFCASSGNITDEIIMDYIANQEEGTKIEDKDFSIKP